MCIFFYSEFCRYLRFYMEMAKWESEHSMLKAERTISTANELPYGLY